MFSFNKKPHLDQEITSFDAPPTETHPAMRSTSSPKSPLISSINTGLTVLALLSAITILGTAADTIHVYNTTTLRLADGGILSMWPREFDLRPSVALVVGGAVILVNSGLGLLVQRIAFIKSHSLLSTPLSLFFPTCSLIAALISTSFFYAFNASSTNYTVQSWSCQWRDIEMHTKPHWATLCRESKVALYLSVLMIPLQVAVLGTVVVGFLGRVRGWLGAGASGEGRRGSEDTLRGVEERKGSPAFSLQG